MFGQELLFEGFIHMKLPTKTFQAKKLNKKKDGTPYIFTDPEVVLIKLDLKCRLQKILKDVMPEKPYKTGIICDIYYCYDVNKAKGKEIGELFIKKPDRDNMCKTFQDALEEVKFVKNDSCIADGRLRQSYEEHEGIYFCLKKQVKIKNK